MLQRVRVARLPLQYVTIVKHYLGDDQLLEAANGFFRTAEDAGITEIREGHAPARILQRYLDVAYHEGSLRSTAGIPVNRRSTRLVRGLRRALTKTSQGETLNAPRPGCLAGPNARGTARARVADLRPAPPSVGTIRATALRPICWPSCAATRRGTTWYTPSLSIACPHYRQEGPEELRPVGETAFVCEVAEESARTPGCEIAGIVSFCDMTLGERAKPVLEAQYRGRRGTVQRHPPCQRLGPQRHPFLPRPAPNDVARSGLSPRGTLPRPTRPEL